MADVEELLSQYIAQHRAGGDASPLPYLEQLEGTDRAELELLIDAYLQRSPGRAWDEEEFQGSSAELLADRLTRTFAGEAGAWPVLLPRLRQRARLMRGELARKLAESLGVGGREEKVESYLHEMEQGLLPAEGVKPQVLEGLARLLGTSADALRTAGSSLAGPEPPQSPGAVFARRAGAASPGLTSADEDALAPEGEWDEVDELFRGGSG